MWDLFKDFIFDVIQFFYGFAGDWGMAIIIVTIIFRLLVWPLIHKSTKSNYQMQKIQPKISAIQEKWKDEPTRMNEEMQKLYADAKFNPLAGCLPMLLQMPIFIALFQVLREMGDRIGSDSNYCFYNLVPNLVTTPGDAMAQGPMQFLPYLILMIVFAGATFAPMLLQQKDNQNQQQKKQMYMMSIVMSLMMLWISWSSPAGVLLFWGASSLIGIAQQQGGMYFLRKKDAEAIAASNDADEIVVEPVEIEYTRKAKKKRPSKKR